jgi:hypothetical protein
MLRQNRKLSPLQLNRETVKQLTANDLHLVAGGNSTRDISTPPSPCSSLTHGVCTG